MSMLYDKIVEWKIVPRVSYEIVRIYQAKCEGGGVMGGSERFGSFDSETTAESVMTALKERDPECLASIQK